MKNANKKANGFRVCFFCLNYTFRLLYAFRKASIQISNSLVRKVTLLYLRHSHFVAPTISVKYKSSAN